MNANAVILIACLCLGTSSAYSLPTFIDLIEEAVSEAAYQLVSTFRVVKTLCFDKDIPLTQEFATEFFNCYDKSNVSYRIANIKIYYIHVPQINVYDLQYLPFNLGHRTSHLHQLPNPDRRSRERYEHHYRNYKHLRRLVHLS